MGRMSKSKKKELLHQKNSHIDKLVDEFDYNTARATNASVAKIETMSFPILSMMFGDVSGPVLWKILGLVDNVHNVEESVTLLCLLTDYISSECASIGMCDMVSELSGRWGSDPTNFLKQLAATWNNVLLKAKQDLKVGQYNSLINNLENYTKVFKSHGLDKNFNDTLEMAHVLKNCKNAHEMNPYDYIMTVQPHLPLSATIPHRTMMKIWCASSNMYCPKYDKKFRKLSKHRLKGNHKPTSKDNDSFDNKYDPKSETVENKHISKNQIKDGGEKNTENHTNHLQTEKEKKIIQGNVIGEFETEKEKCKIEPPSTENKKNSELYIGKCNVAKPSGDLHMSASVRAEAVPTLTTVFKPRFKKTIESKLKQKNTMSILPEENTVKKQATPNKGKDDFWKYFDDFENMDDKLVGEIDASRSFVTSEDDRIFKKFEDALHSFQEQLKDMQNICRFPVDDKDKINSMPGSSFKQDKPKLVEKNINVYNQTDKPRMHLDGKNQYAPPTKSYDSTFNVSWSTAFADKSVSSKKSSFILENDNKIDRAKSFIDTATHGSLEKQIVPPTSKSTQNSQKNFITSRKEKDIRCYFSNPLTLSPSPRKRKAVDFENNSPVKSPRFSLSFGGRV